MRAAGLVGMTLRIGSATMVLGQLHACTSWRVEPVQPARLVEQRHPPEIQVRRTDGTRLVLGSPAVRGDSLIGVERHDTTGVALGDVTAVALRRFDWLETAGLAVVTTGAVFAVVCAVACEHGVSGFGD